MNCNKMWWQDFTPNPILFSWGFISIHWYGLIIVLAIIAGSLYGSKYLKSRLNFSSKQIEDLAFYIIVFGLIGARLGHVIIFEWRYYSQNLLDIFKVWNGGMSIQGAVILAIIILLIWSRKNKVNFWRVSDILVPAVALGQAIGRWGNYFNQELYGKPTSGWWGIPIDEINRVDGYEKYFFFHPTFFYESVLNLALFIFLHKTAQKLKIANPGLITLVYLIAYSVIRILMEFVRIDQTLILFGIRMPQLISLLVILVSGIFIYRLYLKPLPKLEK